MAGRGSAPASESAARAVHREELYRHAVSFGRTADAVSGARVGRVPLLPSVRASLWRGLGQGTGRLSTEDVAGGGCSRVPLGGGGDGLACSRYALLYGQSGTLKVLRHGRAAGGNSQHRRAARSDSHVRGRTSEARRCTGEDRWQALYGTRGRLGGA